MKINIPEQLRLKIAIFSIVFNTKDTHPFQWIVLSFTAGVLNALLWPFIIVSCINMVFGTQINWLSINAFFGVWGLILTLGQISNNE